MFDSIEDIVLASMAKTVWRDVEQVWNQYQKLCNKNNVTPLWGQFETCVRRIKHEGKIICRQGEAKLA